MTGLHVQEIANAPDIERVFLTLSEGDTPFFLDSALMGKGLGGISLLGSEPFVVISSRGREVTIREKGNSETLIADPIEALRKTLSRHRVSSPGASVPFPCGGVGFFAYEFGRQFESLPERVLDDLGFPEMFFAFYDYALVFDHVNDRTYAVGANVEKRSSGDLRKRVEARTRSIFEKCPSVQVPQVPPAQATITPDCNFTKSEYINAIERAKRYISAGDIYQVNLSQRFTVPVPEKPAALYLRLRDYNPAPFSAYLDFGEGAALSTSPERFMKLTGRRAETRPIKGTMPRREGDLDFNRAMREKLLESEKDAAELAMIVDLERNDLGRVSEYGSVEVTRHREIEEYATVYHLVSTVESKLRPGEDALSLIRASFPGGSITGAPKIRAMEIIDELEPTARSVYTGSIGYLGFDGNMDMNIAIRTTLVKSGRAYFQFGGGIVADSDPESEYEETLHKGKAIFRALGAS